MTPAAVRAEGVAPDYYAPAFAVKVEGVELSPEDMGDVLELVVTMDEENLTSVDLKLNNYDDRAFDLKWSETDDFRIGKRVRISLGYAGRLLPMTNGVITALTPAFPADGTPTLGVRVVDAMVKLKGSKPPEKSVSWTNVRDSDIARQIAQRHNLRFEVQDSAPRYKTVDQHNLDDAQFLKERAKKINFVVFMATDPKSGEDVLTFARPADGRGSGPVRTFVLSWGTLRNTDVAPSLIEFRPTITAAHQVKSVTVRGWDVDKKQAISATARAGNTPDLVGAGVDAATDIGGENARDDVVVHCDVENHEQALSLARAMLAQRAYAFRTAKGKLIGLPELRLNDNVEIHGVGARFGGLYHVTKVVHTLNDRGYVTEFEARGA